MSFFYKFHWSLLQSWSSERESEALTDPKPLKNGPGTKGWASSGLKTFTVSPVQSQAFFTAQVTSVSEMENNFCFSGTSSGYSHPNGCKLRCVGKICHFEVNEKHLYSNSGRLCTV